MCACANSYHPSNGTEGMDFTDHYCANCIHEKWMHTQKESDKKCEILSNSMIFSPWEPGYPKEWVEDEGGRAECTEFVKWDWGNDEDGWNEPPPAPTPPDPNQTDLFPLYPKDPVETNTQGMILKELLMTIPEGTTHIIWFNK